MAKQVQRRRGTATQHNGFTGAEGEISVNTTNKSIHVHDGVTASGFEAARSDLNNVTGSTIASSVSGETIASLTITSADINGGSIDGVAIGSTTAAAGSFTNVSVTGTVDGRDIATDGTKLDGIEANADVTDTANVTAAGALMDSEVTNLAQVKAFDSADYATAAQGALADSALQAETNDLSSVVTWANVPDANITESSVTQHESALTITESQISDLGPYDPAGTAVALAIALG